MSGDATEVFSAVCGASIRKVRRPYSHKPKVHQRNQERIACGIKLRWTGSSSIQAGRAVPRLVQLMKEKQKDSRNGFAPRLCPDSKQKERRRVEARENQPLKKDIIHVGSRSHA